jgi:predicted permease
VILAIGIGTNAAVLGVIDAAFFRRLPVPQPNAIIAVYSTQAHNGRRPARLGATSFADYSAIRGQVAGAEGLAAYQIASLTVDDGTGAVGVTAALISGSYFGVLHVNAQRGRVINDDDERMGNSGLAVVISDAMWRSRFGAADSAVGAKLTIAQQTFTVVGVAPKGFTGTHPEGRTDVWLPYTSGVDVSGSHVDTENHSARVAAIIGRLSAHASLRDVQFSLDNVARDLGIRFPEADSALELHAISRPHLAVPEEVPGALPSFLLVWVMVLLVHLVACSNVAMLVVARGASRRQELGIRLCLGASRHRIIWQALVESAVLALLGGIGGGLLAQWLIRLVTHVQFLSAFEIGLDWRILAIVFAVTVLTALQFGLWPAKDAAREDPVVLLGGASGSRVKGGRDRSVKVILVVQVAVCLILCVNAGVVVHGFKLQAMSDPGFKSGHVVVASIGAAGVNKTEWLSAHDAALERVRSLPGVRQASSAAGAPLFNAGVPLRIVLPGQVRAPDEPMTFFTQRIGPGYFATLGATIIHGREFETTDRGAEKTDAYDVVIVNDLLARRLWPTTDAIGQLVILPNSAPARVVGVVANVLDVNASAAVPRVYVPLLESRHGPFEIVVQTDRDPTLMTAVLRSALSSQTSRAAPVQVTTLADIHEKATAPARIAGLGLTACAVVALLLVSIGLYGTVAGWVAARQAEIGVRLALGAPVAHVHALILGSVFRLVGIGCVVGAAASLGIARIERIWLGPFFVSNPLTIVLAITPLVLSAGIAAFIPSRRAVTANPAAILRGN